MVDDADPRGFPPVAIRPPKGAEARACRMLLPEAAREGGPTEFLLAVSRSPSEIVGAAAYAPALHDGRPALRIALRVIRTHPRRGIGSGLMASLVATARGQAIEVLAACHERVPGLGGDAFLRRHGFSPRDRIVAFESDAERLGFLGPLRDRLAARGKVPAAARVVPLREAPSEPVVRMHAEALGGPPGDVRRRLGHAQGAGASGDTSVALMVGGDVAGVLLCEVVAGRGVVHSCIVVPRFRGGWANALLKGTALERMVAQGATRIAFSSALMNRDTLKLAARCSAVVEGVTSLYVLDLPGG